MLERRGETNDTPDERAVQLLDEQVRDARFFLRRPHFEVLEVTYAEVLGGARPQAQRMASFLGQPLDVGKMAEVVDLQLYRNRST
jgi:hypothetical protein